MKTRTTESGDQRRKEIVTYLRRRCKKGLCASVREIGLAVGLSTNAVRQHLAVLRKQGKVTWDAGVCCTIRLTGQD